ncbi:hypothetical protein DFH06DRAFT_29979 [Mycena polygramma]|nr:hypothetical protein DFH06DRAFT_29979 [Mycena polygramma]
MSSAQSSNLSDESDNFDGDIKQPSRSRKVSSKSSGACVHCKSLKVRCEFSSNQTICQRCQAGNYQCLARSRKKRKPAPTHEDLQEKAHEQDRQIEVKAISTGPRIEASIRTRRTQRWLIFRGVFRSSVKPTHCPILLSLSSRDYGSICDFFRETDLIWSSPFLFTVICATASRFYTLNPNLYPKAHAFARDAAAIALIDESTSVDICQAYLILALYPVPKKKFADDRSWLLMGVAIRMAIELELNQPPPPLCNERERLNRTRTWLNCYAADASHAIQLGKMPMLDLNDYMARTSRDWYQSSSLNSPFDVHLCAYVQMLLLIAEWRKTRSAEERKSRLDIITSAIQAQSKLTKELAHWVARFDRDHAIHPLPICVYRGNTAQMITAYLRLVILADGFQYAATKKGLARDSDVLRLSIDAARTVIQIALDRLYPTGNLKFAMEANWVYISFASAFLVNLLRPRFLPLLKDNARRDIVRLVSRLIDVLGSDAVALDGRHTPALYSRFLSSLLAKHNVFPLRDDSPPQDDVKSYRQFEPADTPPNVYSWPDIAQGANDSPLRSEGSVSNFIRAVNAEPIIDIWEPNWNQVGDYMQ